MFRVNPSSGIPLYLQLMEQVKHAVETGALREGDRLPTIRKVAEDLVMNPNTVVRSLYQSDGRRARPAGSRGAKSDALRRRAADLSRS